MTRNDIADIWIVLDRNGRCRSDRIFFGKALGGNSIAACAHADGLNDFADSHSDPNAPYTVIPLYRASPARPQGTAAPEPWAVYSTLIHHVQRTYALKAEAEHYRDDINKASKSKTEWVVVNVDVIGEARASPPSPGVSRADVEALPQWDWLVGGLSRVNFAGYVRMADILALFSPAPASGETK